MDALTELAILTSEASSTTDGAPGTISNFAQDVEKCKQSTGFRELSQRLATATRLEDAHRAVQRCCPHIQQQPKELCMAFDKLATLASKRVKQRGNSEQHTGKYRRTEHPLSQGMSSSSNPALGLEEKAMHMDTATASLSEGWHNTLKQMLIRLPVLLREKPDKFDNEDFCALLHGIAVSGMKANEACTLATKEILRKSRSYTLKQLQELLWSFTKCLEQRADAKGGINFTVHDKEFVNFILKGIVELTQQKPSRIYPSQMASMLRCLVRLSHKEEALMQLLAKQILIRQNEFSEKDWTACITAFNHFGMPLRGDCKPMRLPYDKRDWEHPPAPKRPKPMSEC